MNASHVAEIIKRDFHSFNAAERRAIVQALHPHLHAKDINLIEEDRRSRGDRIADRVTKRLGSWPFIIVQSIVLVVWIFLNVLGWLHHWDPYPFILLNLGLSFQAAYSAPIIMMSQNRQAEKDRLAAANDFNVNLHSEAEIAVLRTRLDELSGQQWEALIQLQHQQIYLLDAIHGMQKDGR